MLMANRSSATCYYQSNKKLFCVCFLTSPTTGGATASFRMQEGSLSLMQLWLNLTRTYLLLHIIINQIKELFYVSILTSPTTGGVTASSQAAWYVGRCHSRIAYSNQS
uniref:Acetyl-CoA carboxylase beta subunit n=1 Tax=Allium ovalifolium TaxID=165645 RepID=A0A650CZQ3_9ASPA|nr:acetyl-CoA carboxylase beta subunit [Allium ovalifolium]